MTKILLAGFIVSTSLLLIVVLCVAVDVVANCMGNASKNLKAFSQGDPGEYNNQYTVQEYGAVTCGEAAMAMIFNAYAGSDKYKIADILQKGEPYNLYIHGEGTDTTKVPVVSKLFGMQAEIHHFDLDKIIESANNGNPVMLLIHSPYTPGGGHFIVVVGGDAQNVRIADSGAPVGSPLLLRTTTRAWLLSYNGNYDYVTFQPDGAGNGTACNQQSNSPNPTGSANLSNNDALKMLTNAGITVTSSGNCSNRNSFSCTSLDQVRSKTIQGIIAFQKNSSCKITITGGTEYGHAGGTYSHSNGYKLDIAPTACVTNYIHSHFAYKGLRGGDNAPMYDDPNGNRFANEGSHWDIVFY
jgi:peptidase C39-like protein